MMVLAIAYTKKMLTIPGGIAAFFTGMLFYMLGGIRAWLLLILFFTSSYVIGFVKKKCLGKKTMPTKRNIHQVLCNSLPALLCLFLFRLTSDVFILIGMASVIAEVTADTWASEIGILSPKKPVSIVTLKPVEVGLSGGVTLMGTVASCMGSFLISLCFACIYHDIPLLAIVVLFFSGVLGSMTDSVMGGLLQVKNKCSICHEITEKKSHHGQSTQKVSGIFFINNDLVNLFSGLITVGISMLFCFLLNI